MPTVLLTAVVRRYRNNFPHDLPRGPDCRVSDIKWKDGRVGRPLEIQRGRRCRMCHEATFSWEPPCGVPRDDIGEPQTCYECGQWLQRRFMSGLPQLRKGSKSQYDKAFLYAVARYFLWKHKKWKALHG